MDLDSSIGLKNTSTTVVAERNGGPVVNDSQMPSDSESRAVKPGSGSEDDGCVGMLDVFVFGARDIQNICIYHKQDVYAKLCLTSDPESAVSTEIINGGGQNPVFNDSVRLRVRRLECSIKCEIWMMSRVRNYLEDQLLGFTLVPLSEIFARGGNLEKEFTLSSTELFHSPAGLVKLGITYNGDFPLISEGTITSPEYNSTEDSSLSTLSADLGKIEFPDPKILTENSLMVSEYFELSRGNVESVSSDSLISTDNCTSDTLHEAESFTVATGDSDDLPKSDSLESSISTDESSEKSASSIRAESAASAARGEADPRTLEQEKMSDDAGECDSSFGGNSSGVAPPEPELKKQDFVDLYMKSMQQFTESLAKMKLPLDKDEPPSTDSNTTGNKNPSPPKTTGSRVYYGSRAFF